MELDLQPTTGKNYIQSFEPGNIKVNGVILQSSIILSASCLERWSVNSIEKLSKQDLESLLKYKPEVILIGAGLNPWFLSAELIAFIQQHSVGIETMTTAAACRTYNVLLNEDRNVLAALII